MIPRTIEQTCCSVATVGIPQIKTKGCFKKLKSYFWLYFALLAVLFLPTRATALTHQSSALAEGHWEGAIAREGKTWRVNLDIESRPTGPVALVDLADYAVYDISFTVTADTNKLRVERKQPTGATVSFIGTVDGDTFSGEFTGVGITAPFRLKRTDKTPVVFKEEEVIFRNRDVSLAGTLIIPKGHGPHPAIVVTHGGGPDSRQKNAYRSDGYFFAHLGVAAFIYDKRGVGKSTGEYQTASLEDLADDALAGVRLLKARKDIDGRHIGVMGTSQGGWISPLAATRSSDVAFIIVISAAGMNPMEQSIFSIENVLKNAGYSQEVVNRATELRNRLYARARTGSFDANFLTDVDQAHTEKWFELSELPYPVAPSLSAGARRFLLFEPAPTWEKVKVPVLTLWGEDDIYLPAQRSMAIVETSLRKGGNKKSTLKIFPHAEHGLSVVRASTDGWDFPRAVSGSRELMAEWIAKQSGVKKPAENSRLSAIGTQTTTSGIEFRRPQFIALSVPNLEDSTKWYSRVFDMPVVKDAPSVDASVHSRVLESPDLVVELSRHSNARSLQDYAGKPTPTFLVYGFFKAGFYVANLDSAIKVLRDRGVSNLSEIQVDRNEKLRWVLFRDNSGNFLERLN